MTAPHLTSISSFFCIWPNLCQCRLQPVQTHSGTCTNSPLWEYRVKYLPSLTSLLQSSLAGAVIRLNASFEANAMSDLCCAEKFAPAAILLYLVTSFELYASAIVVVQLASQACRSVCARSNLPLFSSSVSRPVSFAASVDMVWSSCALVSRLISSCLGSASYVIPLSGCHLTIRFSTLGSLAK